MLVKYWQISSRNRAESDGRNQAKFA